MVIPAGWSRTKIAEILIPYKGIAKDAIFYPCVDNMLRAIITLKSGHKVEYLRHLNHISN